MTSLIHLSSEEYKSDFRKIAENRPLHVIIFLTVSVLPNTFPTEQYNVCESISSSRSFILTDKFDKIT